MAHPQPRQLPPLWKLRLLVISGIPESEWFAEPAPYNRPQRVSPVHRCDLIKGIWGHNPGNVAHQDEYDSYLVYLEDYLALKFNPEDHVLETFGELFDLLECLRDSCGYTKSEITQTIGPYFPHGLVAQRVYNSLELAARLWFMFGLGLEAQSTFVWDEDKTLHEAVMTALLPTAPQTRYLMKLANVNTGGNPQQNPFIAVETPANLKYLGTLEKTLGEDQSHERNARVFPDTFSLHEMARLTLFHIVWTNDILQHLLVKVSKKSKPSVYVFHHATILREMWLYKDGEQHPYRELAEETLRTLGLLIPNEDLDTAPWFDKQRGRGGGSVWPGYQRTLHTIDARAGTQLSTPEQAPPSTQMWGPIIIPVSRRVGNFRIWQARLLALEDTYSRASPRNILGFWRDRRNLREWYTFWIALLGLILVLIGFLVAIGSLAAGIVSIKEAKEANRFASIASIANEQFAAFESSAVRDECCCLTLTIGNITSVDVLNTSGEPFTAVISTNSPTSLITSSFDQGAGRMSATLTQPPSGQVTFFSAGRPTKPSTT